MLFGVSSVYAEDKVIAGKITQADLEERGLTIAEEIPESVAPVQIDSLEELDKLLNVFEQDVIIEDITPKNQELTLFDNPSIRSAQRPTKYTVNTTIFDLSDVGGKVKQRVQYFKHYDEPVLSRDGHRLIVE